eukprot:scaffold202404_cov34-Prasinocladus_malaysianus.AAC.1
MSWSPASGQGLIGVLLGPATSTFSSISSGSSNERSAGGCSNLLLGIVRLLAACRSSPEAWSREETHMLQKIAARASEAIASLAGAKEKDGRRRFSPVFSALLEMQLTQPLVTLLLVSIQVCCSIWEPHGPKTDLLPMTAIIIKDVVDTPLTVLR